jgi:hypothetical protein
VEGVEVEVVCRAGLETMLGSSMMVWGRGKRKGEREKKTGRKKKVGRKKNGKSVMMGGWSEKRKKKMRIIRKETIKLLGRVCRDWAKTLNLTPVQPLELAS